MQSFILKLKIFQKICREYNVYKTCSLEEKRLRSCQQAFLETLETMFTDTVSSSNSSLVPKFDACVYVFQLCRTRREHFNLQVS